VSAGSLQDGPGATVRALDALVRSFLFDGIFFSTAALGQLEARAMIDKPISEIARADIDGLVRDAVPEDRRIDYKQAEWDLASDKGKVEFLTDLTSFANASGGDVVLGITEKRSMTGAKLAVPDVAEGLPLPNPDGEILRMEQMREKRNYASGTRDQISDYPWLPTARGHRGPRTTQLGDPTQRSVEWWSAVL
jgi:hypothetical protein